MLMKRLWMKKCAALALLAGGAIAVPALADMPSMERVKRHQTFTFGDIRIKQTFDALQDPMSPDFMVQVYKKGALMLQLKEASFSTFHASPANSLFVGLSNGGWPGTAVIIFNREGRILLLADHDVAKFDYCMTTSTFMREWYDAARPQVRFPVRARNEGKAAGITLRNCRGDTIDLLDTIARASVPANAALRKEIQFRSQLR